MNGAHLHLLVNHIPVFAVVFGLIALAWAILRNSNEMRWAAIALFVLAGLSGWLAMETGESAETIAEKLAGVTKGLIHEHEEAADFANVSATVLALGAILLAVISRLKPNFLNLTQRLLLLVAIFSSTVMARTAYLGGQIRHSEIRNQSSPAGATVETPTPSTEAPIDND